jgi:hypothetical protein
MGRCAGGAEAMAAKTGLAERQEVVPEALRVRRIVGVVRTR